MSTAPSELQWLPRAEDPFAGQWPAGAAPGRPEVPMEPPGEDPGEQEIQAEQHRGQLRIAYRLSHRYAGRLLHVTGLGWHVWDGARWSPDQRGESLRAVYDTLRAALLEAVEMHAEDREKLHTDVRRCETATGVEGVLRLASALEAFSTTVAELDADPYLLNTPTGTLDLSTGTLRPHDPRDRITKVTGVGYTPEALGATWRRFLEEVLPDAEVRAFVQRLAGLALLGRVVEHLLPILTGVGRNGKTTFVNAVVSALGDYAIQAEPELLIERDRAHPTGMMDLRGARLAVCQETDEGRRLAVATVKRLTGGDPIRARRMRQDFVQFDPSHTPLLVTNHLPHVPGDDPALWRRLRVVPFNVVVEEPDSSLPERLALELPAVLAWAVAGYRAYVEQGLAEPDAVRVATDRYRVSSDVLARFIEDRCLVGPHFHAGARDLWTAWTGWCRESSEVPGTERDFGPALESRGYRARKTKTGKRYDGLGLQGEDG